MDYEGIARNKKALDCSEKNMNFKHTAAAHMDSMQILAERAFCAGKDFVPKRDLNAAITTNHVLSQG